MRYGYFDNERREYVIEKVDLPTDCYLLSHFGFIHFPSFRICLICRLSLSRSSRWAFFPGEILP